MKETFLSEQRTGSDNDLILAVSCGSSLDKEIQCITALVNAVNHFYPDELDNPRLISRSRVVEYLTQRFTRAKVLDELTHETPRFPV